MRRNFAFFAAWLLPSVVESGFWRMNCGKIQVGRVDPVVSPGAISGHVHNIVGGYNIGLNSSYDSLVDSKCTSCETTVDKSAYWTPQLYYQHPNGSFQDVPNSGLIVYYLGRADNGNDLKPFPPGFRMLSGLTYSRSYDDTTKTWDGSRNIADRVSFVCINPSAPGGVQYDTPNLQHTDCPNGMRAQIHFQSCWDGVNLYKQDNSHVAYLSGIDNGSCPPSHPVKFINLFYEAYYQVDSINKAPGGRFVFANGDTTGYGFHGDFQNGWDTSVLEAALDQCAPGPNESGLISDCPPLAAVDSSTYRQSCPERPPLLDEQVYGMLDKLPGCNEVTSGPEPATLNQTTCPASVAPPKLNPFVESTLSDSPVLPISETITNGWKYLGSSADPGNGGGTRTLASSLFRDDAMTIEICQQTCNSKGFSLAGLENGDECWCDNALSVGSTLEPTGATIFNSLICAGNDKEYCGGEGTLMLYQKVGETRPSSTLVTLPSATSTTSSTLATVTPSSTAAANVSTAGQFTYIGCANENRALSGRALSSSSYTDRNMTNEVCSTFCASQNFRYAGTEFANECYCGNTFESGSSLGATGCSTTCAGSVNATSPFAAFPNVCGGTDLLSVWENRDWTPVRTVDTVGAYSYQGCYADSPQARILTEATTDSRAMTVETCVSFCAGRGYALAGVEYASECFCGSSLSNGTAKAEDQNRCNMVCPGDSTEYCGGSGAMNLYKSSPVSRIRRGL